MNSANPRSTEVPRWTSISAFLQFWLNKNYISGPEETEFNVYYSNYIRQFSVYNQHHYAGQTREICDAIVSSRAPRLLEVGAGCGTESLWFSILGADVTAIDLNTPRLDVARKRQEKLRELGVPTRVNLMEASFFSFSADQPFDLIWMEHTFHHLEPRAKVYPKIYDLLKPGGGFFINEVNGWNPLLQLQFFIQRGFKTKTFVTDNDGNRVEYGNERITTPFALRRALEKSGFVVKSVRRFRLLPNSNPPGAFLTLEKIILSVLPFMATHFNLVAYKPRH